MDRATIANRVDELLTINDIDHLEYDDGAPGIACRGAYDDLGRTMHMLYTNNMNDVTKVEVEDEINIGDGSGLYWYITINV